MSAPESILLEAHQLVTGARKDAYGTAEANFQRTAQICRMLGIQLTAHQVPLVQVAIKLSRYAHKPSRDSLVDACGYLELLSQMGPGL